VNQEKRREYYNRRYDGRNIAWVAVPHFYTILTKCLKSLESMS
jgi:hypothetical protein